jgi:GntR family transcriptional regulator
MSSTQAEVFTLLQVRADSAVPIYEQIVSQIIFSIASGDLSVGTLVPSVRDLAQRLLVNPNTVARAYQDLEREGILESKRGLGMEVTAEAVELCGSRRKEIVSERIREALRAAVAASLTSQEVHELVDHEWVQINGRNKSRRG